jgi:hypothetical protein
MHISLNDELGAEAIRAALEIALGQFTHQYSARSDNLGRYAFLIHRLDVTGNHDKSARLSNAGARAP